MAGLWLKQPLARIRDTRFDGLARALSVGGPPVNRAEAFGHFSFLEGVVLEQCPDGDLSGVFPETLASWADWKGPTDFSAAAKAAGLIDAEGKISDWTERVEDLLNQREQARLRMKNLRERNKSVTLRERDANVTLQTRPDQTQSQSKKKNLPCPTAWFSELIEPPRTAHAGAAGAGLSISGHENGGVAAPPAARCETTLSQIGAVRPTPAGADPEQCAEVLKHVLRDWAWDEKQIVALIRELRARGGGEFDGLDGPRFVELLAKSRCATREARHSRSGYVLGSKTFKPSMQDLDTARAVLARYQMSRESRAAESQPAATVERSHPAPAAQQAQPPAQPVTVDAELTLRCTFDLQRRVGPEHFRSFFQHVKIGRRADGALVALAPNRYVKQWIETHYRREVAAAIDTAVPECAGQALNVEIGR